jgi:hypothetical protein
MVVPRRVKDFIDISVFGRRLTITYLREMTPEEVEFEAKYTHADKPDATIEELRRKLDEVPYKLSAKKNG